MTEVKPGQVWADNDKRSRGRTLKVEEVEDGRAICRIVHDVNSRAPGYSRVGLVTKIALSRFRPNSTGYRLVEEAVDWSVVQEISDLEKSFPADAIGNFMPPLIEIPTSFQSPTPESVDWFAWASQCFAYGTDPLSGFIGVNLREGIDGEKAFRQIGACMESRQPKHEHKIAAVAWLSSLFFDAVIYGEKSCHACGHVYETDDHTCPACHVDRALTILGQDEDESSNSD